MSNAAAFGSNIELDGLPEIKTESAVVRDAPVRATAKAVHTAPRVRIILEENDNIPPTGQFFGADGKGYMLKPGIEADVPMSIISILNTAIMSVPIINPDTQQVTGFRDRLRFPYRVMAHLPAQAAA